jgi:hypothetical protein
MIRSEESEPLLDEAIRRYEYAENQKSADPALRFLAVQEAANATVDYLAFCTDGLPFDKDSLKGYLFYKLLAKINP